MSKRYRVRVGLNYVPIGAEAELRREPGEEIVDLPAGSIAGLIGCGAIEPVGSVEVDVLTVGSGAADSEAPRIDDGAVMTVQPPRLRRKKGEE